MCALRVAALLRCVFVRSKTWRRNSKNFEKTISNTIQIKEKSKVALQTVLAALLCWCELCLAVVLCYGLYKRLGDWYE